MLAVPGEVTAIDCLMPDGSQSPFPVLQCRNVYVLPGVPHLLRKKWLVRTSAKAAVCYEPTILSLCSQGPKSPAVLPLSSACLHKHSTAIVRAMTRRWSMTHMMLCFFSVCLLSCPSVR